MLFSLFKKSSGPMTKLFTLEPDDTITKDSSCCAMSSGTVTVRDITSLAELPGVLSELEKSEALGLGIPKKNGADVINIVAKEKLDGQPNTIARTKADFTFPESTITLWDYDSHEREVVAIETPDDMVANFAELDPQWEKVEHVFVPSTSSNIYYNDELAINSKGLHIYTEGQGEFMVPYSKALFFKAVAEGKGYIAITVDGKMLPRTFFDRMVFSPERLIFESGAELTGGLEQRRPASVHTAGADLDMSALKPTIRLEDDYKRKLKQLCKEAQPDAAKAKRIWVEKETDRLYEEAGGDIPRNKCQRLVMSRRAGHLYPDDLLHFDELENPVQVRDVLGNFEVFKGMTMCDPVEPDAGRNKAKLMDNKRIHSFLHGGCWYTLHDSGTPKATVSLIGTPIEEQVDQLHNVLSDGSSGIYKRGDVLVRTNTDVENTPKPLTPLSATDFITESGRSVRYIGLGTDGEEVSKDCPTALAKAFLEQRGKLDNIPAIQHISHIPTITPDGEVLMKEGYYAEHRLLLHNLVDIPEVPVRPNKKQIEQAKMTILSAYVDFPFVDGDSRAVALSLPATAMLRPMLPTVPLHGFTALAPGTGKSKCVKTGVLSISHQQIAVVPVGKNEEEKEKRISASLLEGENFILMDNLTTPLGGELLNAATTESALSLRVLGYSTKLYVPNTAVWTATGNNLTFYGDMCRRSVLCAMDAGVENPSERDGPQPGKSWTHPKLEDYVAKNRAQFIWSWLVLIRAFLNAGMPQSDSKKLGGFEEWSLHVAGMLEHFNLGNPIATQIMIYDNDPDREEMQIVFGYIEALCKWTGDKDGVPLKIICDENSRPFDPNTRDSKPDNPLTEVFGRGVDNAKVLKPWLKKYKNRVVDGKMLVYKRGKVGKWKIK